MKGQVSFFDGNEPLKITKPIRLIELFAGIGTQAKALENLGVPFEHYRICEFDKYAVKSYNAVHGTNFDTSDVTKIHAEDLGVVDTDKYCYIMTYSFPCTDLSKAGKQAGMSRESGTRSGLLWEVERLLKEMTELPQILLMENVPDVVSPKFIGDFAEWVAFLDGLGYTSKWDILNAKNYGIPQNRERCFMVSWLGDFYYDFPDPIHLKLCLKDMLEDSVDEKYYLPDTKVAELLRSQSVNVERPHRPLGQAAEGATTGTVGTVLLSRKQLGPETDVDQTLQARDYKGLQNQQMMACVIEKPGGADGIYLKCTGPFQRGPLKDVSRTLKAVQHDAGVVMYGDNLQMPGDADGWQVGQDE